MKPIWFLTKFQSTVKQPQVARLFPTLASWTLRTQNFKKIQDSKIKFHKMKVLLLCGNLPCFSLSALKDCMSLSLQGPFLYLFLYDCVWSPFVSISPSSLILKYIMKLNFVFIIY